MSAIEMYDAGDLGWAAEDHRLCKPLASDWRGHFPADVRLAPCFHFSLLRHSIKHLLHAFHHRIKTREN